MLATGPLCLMSCGSLFPSVWCPVGHWFLRALDSKLILFLAVQFLQFYICVMQIDTKSHCKTTVWVWFGEAEGVLGFCSCFHVVHLRWTDIEIHKQAMWNRQRSKWTNRNKQTHQNKSSKTLKQLSWGKQSHPVGTLQTQIQCLRSGLYLRQW